MATVWVRKWTKESPEWAEFAGEHLKDQGWFDKLLYDTGKLEEDGEISKEEPEEREKVAKPVNKGKGAYGRPTKVILAIRVCGLLLLILSWVGIAFLPFHNGWIKFILGLSLLYIYPLLIDRIESGTWHFKAYRKELIGK